MSPAKPIGLFEAFGVEIEYMLVHADSLNVFPASDIVLRGSGPEFVSEIEVGPLNWSNELVLHVLELKTGGPAESLQPLARLFQDHVRQANDILSGLGGRLMPSAMHPWMNPDLETRVWPHEYSTVYEAFNRIFDCRGHGWSNLQSVHINLPFQGDDQFARLHTAIRLLLPIMPALAASSPLLEGQVTGLLDTRLDVYRTNARRIPSITGHVVPEAVRSAAEYEANILQPMYRDIAPFDAEGDLQEEWLNARGAIARFDRGAIEIRVLDVQENPTADLAIVQAIVSVLRELVAERWTPLDEQLGLELNMLHEQLLATIRDADQAVITDENYLRQFGWSGPVPCTAGELWRHLTAATGWNEQDSPEAAALRRILEHGPLARRILKHVGSTPSREQLAEVYRRLCDCLALGEGFE